MRILRSLHRELIPGTARRLFVRHQFRSPHFKFLWHYHPEIELTLIRRGEGLRYAGGSVERYRAGDLCLLGSGFPHSWSSVPGRGPVESIVFQFLPPDPRDGFWKLEEWRGLARFLRRTGEGWVVEGPGRRRVVERIDALEKVPAGSARQAALFLELLAGLAGETRLRPLPGTGAGGGSGGAALQAVLRYAEAHADGEIAHAEAARLARRSPAAFCRFFKRHMGKTFGEHVGEIRLTRIGGELVDTDRPVTEIALAGGYQSLAHFNRAFRARFGCTPREYRRRGALPG